MKTSTGNERKSQWQAPRLFVSTHVLTRHELKRSHNAYKLEKGLTTKIRRHFEGAACVFATSREIHHDDTFDLDN